MAKIHPTAIVSPEAELAADVEIGPYCVVGPHVVMGEGCQLMAHVVIEGHTRIGPRCTFFPFACVGMRTQDLKYRGGTSYVEIGEGTTVREFVTVHAATAEGGVTRIGARCLIMAYAHVAHDCVLGDEVIIANAGTLAGHVVVESQAILGGLSGVHQFVRLGRLCIVGGCSKVTQDVPPFMMADGHPLAVRGLNTVGLKRRGISEEAQRALKKAHRLLYRSGLTTREALARIREEVGESLPEVRHLVEFVEGSQRGITR